MKMPLEIKKTGEVRPHNDRLNTNLKIEETVSSLRQGPEGKNEQVQ